VLLEFNVRGPESALWNSYNYEKAEGHSTLTSTRSLGLDQGTARSSVLKYQASVRTPGPGSLLISSIQHSLLISVRLHPPRALVAAVPKGLACRSPFAIPCMTSENAGLPFFQNITLKGNRQQFRRHHNYSASY
jgi:hypothetical protein